LISPFPAIREVSGNPESARFYWHQGFTGQVFGTRIAREVELDAVLLGDIINYLEDEKSMMSCEVPLSKKKAFGLMNAAHLMQRILSPATLPEWASGHRMRVQSMRLILLEFIAEIWP